MTFTDGSASIQLSTAPFPRPPQPISTTLRTSSLAAWAMRAMLMWLASAAPAPTAKDPFRKSRREVVSLLLIPSFSQCTTGHSKTARPHAKRHTFTIMTDPIPAARVGMPRGAAARFVGRNSFRPIGIDPIQERKGRPRSARSSAAVARTRATTGRGREGARFVSCVVQAGWSHEPAGRAAAFGISGCTSRGQGQADGFRDVTSRGDSPETFVPRHKSSAGNENRDKDSRSPAPRPSAEVSFPPSRHAACYGCSRTTPGKRTFLPATFSVACRRGSLHLFRMLRRRATLHPWGGRCRRRHATTGRPSSSERAHPGLSDGARQK